MEQSESLFDHELLANESTEQLDTTSKWTRFIGIVYLVIGIMMLVMFIFMITNMDELAQVIMNQIGMDQQVMDFISQWGKILFGLIMLGISIIIFLNAYYLLQIRSTFSKFTQTGNETHLGNSFDSIGKYFQLATILSILSTISSIGIIIFMALK